jgi:uncharacterized protein with PIN domain
MRDKSCEIIKNPANKGETTMWDDENQRRQMEKRIALFDLKKELTQDLLPCPFCGAKIERGDGWALLEKWRLSSDEWRITCPHCSAAGAGAQSIEWAVLNWNTRAGVEK